MSLETEIREAFERHATDTRPGANTWPMIEQRIRRAHRSRIIVSAVGAAIAITAVAVAVPRLGSRVVEPLVPPTSAPTAVPGLTAKIPLSAIDLASGLDAIWALSLGEAEGEQGTLHRIDPATNRVTGRVRVGVDPSVVAVGGGSVWVLNGEGCGTTRPCESGERQPLPGEERTLWRINPRSFQVERKISVGLQSDVVIGTRFAWVASYGGGLQRVDLQPNAREPIEPWGSVAGGGRVRLVVGDGLAWAVSEEPAFLSIIDLSRRELQEILDVATHGTVPDVALGFGSAWVTASTETSASGLMRVDSSSRRVVAKIVLPDAAPLGLTSVTTGYGYVWATSARGYLWKVDPLTNSAPIEPLLIGDAPPVPATDVVLGSGSIWVASGDGMIWRFEP